MQEARFRKHVKSKQIALESVCVYVLIETNLYFLFCWLCIVAAFEPDFVFPLENITISQGRDATFTCVVNNLGGYRVSGDSAQARVRICNASE